MTCVRHQPDQYDSALCDELLRIIKDKDLRVCFSPVVLVDKGNAQCFEAQIYGPGNSPLRSKQTLTEAAARFGLMQELEYTGLTTALYVQHELPDKALMLINLSPALMASNAFREITNLCAYMADRLVFRVRGEMTVKTQSLIETRKRQLEHIGYRVLCHETTHETQGVIRDKTSTSSLVFQHEPLPETDQHSLGRI